VTDHPTTLPLWPAELVPVWEEAPRLTPYLVDGPGPHPAIVVCPGGAYRRRAPHEGEPIARWLNSLGIAAFVLDYRVAPNRHPAPLHDAQRAIRTVRHHAAEWRADGTRVGILGFSAGGHLAAAAGTHPGTGELGATDPVDRHSARPDLLVLCYPVITFGEHRHEGSMLNLLGDDPSDEARQALSVERCVTAETPPTFLWHTAEDGSVPVQNSLLFAKALARNDVPFALHVFPHGRHGLGLAADDRLVGAWTRLCAGWLAGQGWGASS
jgi:acetyl esterase/lipase